MSLFDRYDPDDLDEPDDPDPQAPPHYRPHTDAELPPGYVIARSDPVDRLPSRGLAVPRHLIRVLNADVWRRSLEALAALSPRTDLNADLAPPPPPAPTPPSAPSAFGVPKRPSVPDHHVDTSALDAGWPEPADGEWARVWDPQSLHTRIESHNDTIVQNDRDQRTRDAAILRRMLKDGPWRRCQRPHDLRAMLRALREDCPSMEPAIGIVAERLLLAEATATLPQIPPLLLVGQPGLGKTHFATRLSQLLCTTLRRIDFGSQQTNSVMSGSDRHWSNSSPGMLFEMLVLDPGGCANPVLVLDEIDKTSRNRVQYDPLPQLNDALEPSTSRSLRDQSVGIIFDASRVTYIATANSLQGLPDALLSRAHVVHIEAPGPRQALATARAVIRRCLSEGSGLGFSGAAPEIVVALADRTPRDIVRLFTAGMARAAAAGRTRIELRDLNPQDSNRLLH